MDTAELRLDGNAVAGMLGEMLSVDATTIERTPVPPHLTESLATAPVVLVVCLDLKVVASIDQDLDRVGAGVRGICPAFLVKVGSVATQPPDEALVLASGIGLEVDLLEVRDDL